MNTRPSWLANYGTILIVVIFLISLGAASVIKYPETISANAVLRATNAPKPVWVYQSGKLVKLFKTNGEIVEANELLGCIESNADWQQVIELSADMDSVCSLLELNKNNEIPKIINKSRGRLGELQSDYQSFIQDYLAFEAYVLGDFANKKRLLLQKDIQFINKSKKLIDQQSALYNQDIQLSKTNLDNNKELLKDNVISEQEYRDLISRDLGKKMSIPQVQSSYVSSDAQRNEKDKELLDLDNEIRNQLASFRQSAYKFKSSIDNWKHNYLLTASTNGVLSFTSFIQEKQVLEAGVAIGYISPSSNSYFLQTVVPQNNLGKIIVGQRVLLKFSAWQWQEYGTVTGYIEYVSNIATDSGYVAKVSLPNGLITNQKKTILYKEGLLAQAEIITKDMTLIKRFYYNMIQNARN